MLDELKNNNINSFLLAVKKDDQTIEEIPIFTNNIKTIEKMIKFSNDEEIDLFIPTITNIIFTNAKQYFSKFNLKIKRILFEFLDRRHEDRPNITFNFIYDTYSPDANINMFVLGALTSIFEDESDSFQASSMVSLIEEGCKFRFNDIIYNDIKLLEENFHDILNKDYENQTLKEVAIANFLSDLITIKSEKEQKMNKYNDKDYEFNCSLFEVEFQYHSDDNIVMNCAEMASYDETEDSIFNNFFNGKLKFPSIDEIKEAVKEFKEKTQYEI